MSLARRSFLKAALLACVAPSILVACQPDRVKWKGKTFEKQGPLFARRNPEYINAPYEQGYTDSTGKLITVPFPRRFKLDGTEVFPYILVPPPPAPPWGKGNHLSIYERAAQLRSSPC
jgi:hypothetical protein